jgi:hypothetical protein
VLKTGCSSVDPPSNPTPTTVTADLSSSLSNTEVHVVSVPPAASVSVRVHPFHWRKLSLVPLSKEEEAYVQYALDKADPNQNALPMPYDFDLRFRDFHCLRPRVWLKDAVINTVMLLLQNVSEDTMVLSSFTKDVFLREYHKGGIIVSREKLGRQLAKHLEKYQVRCTTGLNHTFLIILSQLNAQELRKVLVPLNLDDVHWVLLVVQLDQNLLQPTCVVARSEIRIDTLRTYTNHLLVSWTHWKSSRQSAAIAIWTAFSANSHWKFSSSSVRTASRFCTFTESHTLEHNSSITGRTAVYL